MNAIQTLLAGLVDYAGIYPPASLDMRAAVRNYLNYCAGRHREILGRFIVDISRLEELRGAAGDALSEMRLSVIAPADGDWPAIGAARRNGFRIESIETIATDPAAIAHIRAALPGSVECYCEIPLAPLSTATLDLLKANGMRAKLRMGGVTPEAIPAAHAITPMLRALVARGIAFKATAGLHHPVRSHHKLTYASDSISGVMHGFLNLLAAAAILCQNHTADNAHCAIEEQAPSAFRISADRFGWHDFVWNAEQLHSIRKHCFVSFGSCSFVEPIADLEAFGWL